MANTKTTGLDELNEAPNDSDLIPIVDVSDTTMSANGTNKKMTAANLKSGLAATSHTHTESDVTDLDHDAVKIQGVGIDATVGTPSDGDILVYRSAGSDWVKEAKPAAGSNPAAADITDATADGIALITSADANPFTDADESKLDAIEASADVTDETNVKAALDGATTTEVTPASTDKLLILDASDSDNLKNITWSDVTDAATGITDVVDDTTPQLGGSLDVNGNAITSVSNGDIELTPDGTGAVVVTDSKGLETTYLRPNTAVSNTIQVVAGSGTSGGDLLLDSGGGTTGDGGDVALRPAASTSGGNNGQVAIVKPTTLQEMRIDNSALSANRTLTMPDADVDLADVANAATASSTTTFTNKTIDANGTGNSISNIDVEDLADGTDGELITWDASGNPATVAVGTSGHVLTSNGAGAAPTFQEAAGGGSGQTTYDVIIASSGGDYTTLGAYAADTPTAGDNVLVRDSTTETGSVSITATGVNITGASKDVTIDLSGGAYGLTLSGNNQVIENLTIDKVGSSGNFILSGDYSRISNIKYLVDNGTTSSSRALQVSGNYTVIENSDFIDSGTYTAAGNSVFNIETADYCRIANNYFEGTAGSSNQNNSTVEFRLNDGATITGNSIYISTCPAEGYCAVAINDNNILGVTFSGNTITTADTFASAVGITTFGAPVITGNTISGEFNVGITSNAGTSTGAVVTGNRIYTTDGTGSTGIIFGSGASNGVAVGNQIIGFATTITDTAADTLYQTATDSDPLNNT